MKKNIKKSDIYLILIIAILAIGAFAFQKIYENKTSVGKAYAVIRINGDIYKKLPLDEDTEVKIELKDGNYNIVKIKDKKAYISEASCPDKICVHEGKISKNHQVITCLPNKVTVTIENTDEKDAADVVAS
ncbi:hypothetical protein SAMN05216249_12130 [Acetitomaculum ruminis DSM 5522]|uniref:Uncharacterized protein n=1 Tax=Acetitomaculum ruminis DSM 5522 TaxID=1120918 RepID=A0A1I1A6M9_9FIRM|nr:NusG domain II-containing protein [Acetitomaculum ruminis]SFB33026.1 hypothetical protein SAMN05216249_12130 [Acetitomaculum ruminis DSM 5522]